MTDMQKIITNNTTETKIHHSDVNKIIERTNKKQVCVEVFETLLKELKPYINNGMCRVRLLTPTDNPDITLKSFTKEGYEPIQIYELFRVPSLRKGIFKDVIIIIIFKRLSDIKMEQLTQNL